jgi:hypothetical protein
LNFQRPARSRTTAISLCVCHGGPAPPGDTLTLTTWRARNILARAPADALGVKQEFEKALAPDGKPTK